MAMRTVTMAQMNRQHVNQRTVQSDISNVVIITVFHVVGFATERLDNQTLHFIKLGLF